MTRGEDWVRTYADRRTVGLAVVYSGSAIVLLMSAEAVAVTGDTTTCTVAGLAAIVACIALLVAVLVAYVVPGGGRCAPAPHRSHGWRSRWPFVRGEQEQSGVR